MKTRILILSICILLSGCTGRYAGFQNSMTACGYPGVAMSKLHTCMSTKVTQSKKTGEQDFYNKSGRDILAVIEDLRKSVAQRKINNKQANTRLGNYMQQEILREQKQAQQAAAVVVLLAGTALLANCAHNGGCNLGGSGYGDSNSYRGNCQYPTDIAADGSRCGNRAASVRPGGWEPSYVSRPASYYNISGPARPARLAKKTTAVKLTDNSQSKDFGMCMFSWQTAKDGSKCGKRATSVRESRRSTFSE